MNIILIGFMAAGKSSVGRMLARRLGWDFLDTDQEIERVTDLKIPDIFRKYGEVRFRSEENLVVKKLAGMANTVIATGGGTALAEGNWELLKELGLVIHLYAPLEVALSRVKRHQERPLLARDTAQLEQLWLERLPYYNKAQITVDTSDKDIPTIVEDILTYLKGGLNHASEN